MPAYMRLPKERGSTSKDAMPIGPFRTVTQAINLRDLETRFEAGDEITPETLKERGLIKNTRIDVKILGQGELTKALSITAHRFSATAKEKIEAAGGSVVSLCEPTTEKSRKRRKIAARKRAAGVSAPGAETEAAEE
jgi:large subunit ribosomal protein L15